MKLSGKSLSTAAARQLLHRFLNRPKLLEHRSKFVKKLWVIASHYHNDTTAREIIDSAIRPEEEYSAFARALKKTLQESNLSI